MTNRLRIVHQKVILDAPIHDVFDYISDHENYANWFPGAEGIEALKDLPKAQEGQVYKERLKLPSGKEVDMLITVVSSVRPSHFEMTGDFKPLHTNLLYELDAISQEQTRMTVSFFTRHPISFVRWLLRLMIRRRLNSSFAVALKTLSTRWAAKE
ncbi:SRPBCC family protein [Ponticaulis koreensis]|uniref:SRPBCC family protein n=1 Tax=Ponticaulis koreensis TaxID=1123045 RepID=UPI0003B4B44D|nr:SRPBCC family protein [Ponticaulis koreensis]